ncbi:hypothetical protein ACWEAF_47425, partial [Streptomyces sp. NPDC005071]
MRAVGVLAHGGHLQRPGGRGPVPLEPAAHRQRFARHRPGGAVGEAAGEGGAVLDGRGLDDVQPELAAGRVGGHREQPGAVGGPLHAARGDPVAVEAALEDELQRGRRVGGVGGLEEQVGCGAGGRRTPRQVLAVTA